MTGLPPLSCLGYINLAVNLLVLTYCVLEGVWLCETFNIDRKLN